MLPYFRRLETSWRGEGPYHGGSGPIGTKLIDDPVMLYEGFEESAVMAGHARSDDLFGDVTTGVGRLELSVGKGERSSTARCYLDPAMARPNLTIVTNAPASRILLEHGRAVGVEYRRGGETETARAEREVILSAGSFQSPQLLMLSGIGPADHLREVGVAPAGRSARCRPQPAGTSDVPDGVDANRNDTFLKNLRLDRATRFVLQWLTAKSGPFTSTACHGIVFGKSRAGLERNDIYLAATAVGLDADLWFPGFTRPPVHRFVNIVAINYPESRGWVKLRSADPADKPRIFYNMLDRRSDMDGLVAGFHMARDIYRQGPQGASIDHEAMPGDAVTARADIEAYIRGMIGLGEHPCGTCSMGIDDQAVVDAQLRVRGVDGLRVADASIMPGIPGGNINIPTIMVGEKATDLIRGRSLPPAFLPYQA